MFFFDNGAAELNACILKSVEFWVEIYARGDELFIYMYSIENSKDLLYNISNMILG